MQNHPIPSVTEPLQYRAIGIFRGIYKPQDSDNFTRGKLLDSEGSSIDAVVLGRVITLMRRYVSMDQCHLWIVYPRCRDSNNLHLQIAGIWEPSTLSTNFKVYEENNESIINDIDVKSEDQLEEGDNYFSIRGELIFTNPEDKEVIIKVRQKQRNKAKKAFPFKIILHGEIPIQFRRHFLSIDVRRFQQKLYIESYDVISQIPKREKKQRKVELNKKDN